MHNLERTRGTGRAAVLAGGLILIALPTVAAASADTRSLDARPFQPSPTMVSSAPTTGDSMAALPVAVPVLAGVVRDSVGTPLSNVQVHLATIQRTTTTDAAGEFSFGHLPAGTYHLDSYRLGFAPGHAEVVVPAEGDTLRVVIVMHQTPLRLQSVQVTAAVTGDTRTVTQSTVELSGQALSRNLGATVAQTLSSEPGLAMRYGGPAASAPVIRGLTGDRILVLQDGQRAGDLSSASADHAVTIDPLAAQRVEVVRGPASLLYGSSALGGVVNVIQNDIPDEIPTHVQGFLAGQAESVTPGGAGSLAVTIPLNQSWAFNARGSARSLDDVRAGGNLRLPNTFSRSYSGTAAMGYVGSYVKGGVAYRGNDFKYGLPAAPDDEEMGAYINGRRDEAIGRAEFDVDRAGIRTVRVDGTAQWYTHDEIEASGEIGTTFSLRTQTANATARTSAGQLSGAFGAQALFKQYEALGEEALTPSANSNSLGVFVFQELALRRDVPVEMSPSIQVGARVDRYSIRSHDSEEDKFGAGRTRDFTNFSGSLGAGLPIRPGLTLSASVARAFRTPTVEELFSHGFHAAAGSYDVGVPDLEPETNTGAEAVLRMESGRLSGQFAAYYNRIDNYITPSIVRDTLLDDEGEERSVPLNVYTQADAALRGLEGQLEFTAVRHVVLGVMGDVVRGDFRDNDAPLPFLPAGRVGGSARFDNGHLSFGAEARHSFARTRVDAATTCPAADNVTPSTPTSCVDLATPAFTLVNLNVGYTRLLGGYIHSLTLRADNVGDVRYWDATSRIKRITPNPGRNLTLVYKVLF